MTRHDRSSGPSALRRFGRSEDGSILIFGIFMLILMLMIGGLAVDVMRFEFQRARLQGTLDRAVLAAASLTQSRSPAEVVRDYVAKAGLEDYLDEPVVNANTLNVRSVTATAAYSMPTVFMKLLDIDRLEAPAVSTAEERVSNVEISLVLDMSNSMVTDGTNPRDRLDNLKVAARDFIDIVMAGANSGLDGAPVISVSIVPYTGQVNAGADLLATYPNVSHRQPYSSCVEFAASDFTTTALANGAPLTGSGNSELFSSSSSTQTPTYYWCPEETAAGNPTVTPFSHDPEALKAAIDRLSGEGSTAIDTGMKWGVTLLDPSTQPSVAALIEDGKVNGAFAGRPLAYQSGNVMKVVVLMTDGQHVNQEPRLSNAVKTGDSDIWATGSATDTNRSWSVRLSNGTYYWKRDGTGGHSGPDTTIVTRSCTVEQVCTRTRNGSCTRWQDQQVCTDTPSTVTAHRLSYPDLWHQARVGWVAGLYSSAGVSGRYSSWVSTLDPTVKNERTRQICDAARAQGITVYSVAFEAEAGGQALLQYCASTTGHYYATVGPQIRTVFHSIASHITQLRLTQ
ncbi:hypothetical protein GQY15_20355 [Rhodobacter sphaeroides]|uniref:TadE/TadG family type IV pilus assembly protein n=1 Tax=Cereibacter sphaeroides TaxID=1063 RepID=UPI00132B82C2|nr:TadE/TadG family type IV pilus assembly protein [Cereibacter sphaeroides]MWP39915.1 hypothetical protein [Cereibacter sphaeroides]